jgi:hypothetical protein
MYSDDFLAKKQNNSKSSFEDYGKLMVALRISAITVKHKSWEYEQEVRIISNFGKGKYQFNPKSLECVILGMNISKYYEKKVIAHLKNEKWKHVRLFKAQRSKSELALDIIELPKIGSN